MQQHLLLAVCAPECETEEEPSDDEVRTSQVPERSEGKTKVIGQQCLPFTVLKRVRFYYLTNNIPVATAPTVYGIETSHLWMLNAIQDKKVATVLTVYGIETST